MTALSQSIWAYKGRHLTGTPPQPRASTSQQTQNICITIVQCWTNVEDVRRHCTNVIQMLCVCCNVQRSIGSAPGDHWNHNYQQQIHTVLQLEFLTRFPVANYRVRYVFFISLNLEVPFTKKLSPPIMRLPCLISKLEKCEFKMAAAALS